MGAIDSASWDAELEYIAPKGVETNGAIQFEIRAAVKVHEGQTLRAGYSANADIILAKKDKAMAVPESVLQFEKDKTFVEVQTAPGTFEKRYITTGLSDGINIEVVSGLSRTDKVKVPQMNVPGEG